MTTQKMRDNTRKNKQLTAAAPRSLTRLEHVRAELARVYRETRTGKIKTQDATRLCYLLVNLAKIIETSDLESRIAALECIREDL